MPHLITGIIALNMGGNAINCPQPGGYKATLKIKRGVFVSFRKQSNSRTVCW